MNSSIRPLPREAAPQRTESDAIIPSQSELTGFNEIFHSQLGSDTPSAEQKAEPERHEPAKTSSPAIDPWSIFAVAVPVVVPNPVPNAPSPAKGSDSDGANFGSGSPLLAPAGMACAPGAGGGGASAVVNSATLIQKLTPISDLPPVSPTAAPAAAEIAEKLPEPAKKADGIPDAKQLGMLLNAEKPAPGKSDEQNHSFVSSPRLQALAACPPPVALRPVSKSLDSLTVAVADKVPVQFDSFSSPLHVEALAAAPESHVVDTRSVNLVSAVRDQVQMIRLSNHRELHVVLRPDAQTELSLQVRQVDGAILLQARCERGDFTWLKSQWSTVQNTLGSQGVRVEPLQSPAATQDRPGSMLMSDHRGSHRDPQRSSSDFFSNEQELPSQRKTSSRPRTSVARLRGWQSWA